MQGRAIDVMKVHLYCGLLLNRLEQHIPLPLVHNLYSVLAQKEL